MSATTAQVTTLCSCQGCGTTAPMPKARVTGAWSFDGEATQWACAPCTRAALDQIEGVDRRRQAS